MWQFFLINYITKKNFKKISWLFDFLYFCCILWFWWICFVFLCFECWLLVCFGCMSFSYNVYTCVILHLCYILFWFIYILIFFVFCDFLYFGILGDVNIVWFFFLFEGWFFVLCFVDLWVIFFSWVSLNNSRLGRLYHQTVYQYR